MPDKRIIHAREDIESILRFADSIGLLLLPIELGEEAEPRPRKPEEFQPFAGVSILLFRSEWVEGSIQVNHIKHGVDAGTYSVRPSTNFSPVKLYFQGDEDIAGVRRLGSGQASFKREWLAEPAHEMRPTPPEVEPVYKQLCKHLLSNVIARGGGHRYHVCKEALELAARMQTLPPFDYIDWPPPNLPRQRKA